MRPRTLLSLLAALLTLALVAGCGGDGGQSADGSTDVDELLRDTFAGTKKIESGRIDASVGIRTQGDEAGTVDVKLTGPFQSTGQGRLPKLALRASLQTSGQTVSGSLTSTGDEGFVGWGGTEYAVAGPLFQQFKASYEQSAKEAGSDRSLASLGMDPRRWLTKARNAGEAKVGDTDTVKITGDVDVPKLLDDLNGALARIRSLGGQGAADRLPDELTAAQRRQVADAVDDLSVEIHTGADDRILRRVLITLRVTGERAEEAADVRLDLQLLDVNEDQDIEAPDEARPFEELVEKLRGLGLDLGGLGAAGAGAGAGAGEGSLETYSRCIQDAAGDNAKIRKCADALETP